MTRQKRSARLLLAGAVASVVFSVVPAPATTNIYCPPEDPHCIALIVACRTLQTAHDKVSPKLPECNLA